MVLTISGSKGLAIAVSAQSFLYQIVDWAPLAYLFSLLLFSLHYSIFFVKNYYDFITIFCVHIF